MTTFIYYNLYPTCFFKRYCKECKKAFSSHKALSGHMRNVHREKTFACPKCSKAFNFKCNLEKHLPVHESEEKRVKFSCKLCNKNFTTKESRNVHQKRHLGTIQGRHKCYFCDYKVRNPQEIRRREDFFTYFYSANMYMLLVLHAQCSFSTHECPHQ